MIMKTEKATFAAGCFWGVEEMFRTLPGVVSTRVGYTGGHVKNATYKQVCYEDTGHAEAVEITYDPSKIKYEQLLDIFWKNHNPTTLNRQGPDVGEQYRSAVFYHSEEQQKLAEASKKKIQEKYKKENVVTEVVKAVPFYEAEDYHQQYLKKRGMNVCH